jgi:hypothetical protein
MPLVFTAEARADEEQNAYNACVDSWNSRRHGLGSYAFVAGVGKKRSTCFWRSNSSGNWNNRLISEAMSDCRRKFKRCFLFGTSDDGLNGWSQRVSDNGGLSRGTIAARRNAAANQQMFNGAMQTFQQMLNQRNQPPTYRPRQTPSYPSNYGVRRQPGGGGGGGSVNDCYDDGTMGSCAMR